MTRSIPSLTPEPEVEALPAECDHCGLVDDTVAEWDTLDGQLCQDCASQSVRDRGYSVPQEWRF